MKRLLRALFTLSLLWGVGDAFGQLSGTYTIDAGSAASASNYQDFTSAVSDLVSGSRSDGGPVQGSGVSGAVTFDVADGTYDEQFIITSVTGATASNTITFQSANADSTLVILEKTVITLSSLNYVVRFDGADWITFKQIHLRNPTTGSYRRVIDLLNNADDNQFLNCIIEASSVSNTTNSTSRALIYFLEGTTGDQSDDLIIKNNVFKYGASAIYMDGPSSGATGLIVENNTFENQYYYGMYLRDVDAPTITGNTLTSLVGASSSYKNMYLYDSDADGLKINLNTLTTMSRGIDIAASTGANYEITGNTITVKSGDYGIYVGSSGSNVKVDSNIITLESSSTGWGIYFNGATLTTALITRNVITGSGRYGIYLSSSSGTAANRGLVANNMISLNGTVYNAIYLNSSDYINIYYNSLHYYGSTSSNGYSLLYLPSSVDYINIKNNIFSNLCPGTYSLCIKLDDDDSFEIESIDNNDYFFAGTNMGYWDAVYKTSFANWIAVSGEANSMNADPKFMSNTNLRLVDGTTTLSEKGVGLASVTTDIDGATRSNPSTIGAYEVPPSGGPSITVVESFTAFASTIGVGSASQSFTVEGSSLTTDITVTAPTNFEISLDDANWATNPIVLAESSGTVATTTMYCRYKPPASGIDGGNITCTSTGATTRTNAINGQCGLEGTYTVGGSSPDYATFTTAVTDLLLLGVGAAVIFDVRDGTYDEQLVITAFTGASASNTVTFISESNDSTLVTLKTTSSAFATNYVVQLDNADYVTFKQMKITNTTTGSYRRVIDILNNADNNQFVNCIIESSAITSTGNGYAVIYSVEGDVGDECDNLTITNNIINYGSYGILFQQPTAHAQGIDIQKNTFEDQYYRIIELEDHQKVILIDNVLKTNTARNDCYGLYLNDCDGQHDIQRNLIYAKPGAKMSHGIYLSGSSSTVGNNGLIANNMVHVTGSSSSTYGIYLASTSEYFNIYYNTINVGSSCTAGTSTAFYTLNSTDDLNIKNNIFSNFSGSSSAENTAYIGNASAVGTIDNNNYWGSTGTNFEGKFGGTTTTVFATYTTASGEINSINIDPQYVDADNGDLQVGNGSLEDAGVDLAPTVTSDYFGQGRPDPPTIGADELEPPIADDAGVISVDQPAVPFTATSQNVYITIRNFGADVLTSTTIKWEVNDVAQTDYSWTGSLATNSPSSSFSIGSFTFAADTKHKIEAWTDIPNGNADGNTANDKTTRYNVTPGLTGTYTIGAAGDFTTWNYAVDSLTNHGVTGAVIFDVKTGTYAEQVSIPVIPGASASNTITFQSESGDSTDVTLTNPSSGGVADNYTFQLNGTDYVTLSKLTVERTGSNTYARVIDLTGDAHNNTITNCQVFGRDGGSGSTTAAIYSGDAFQDDSATTISRNWIRDGYMGIFMEGTSSNLKRTVMINHNKLENYRYGIYMKYMENVTIYQNEVLNAATTNSAATQGFYLFHVDSMLKVQKNSIIAIDGTNNYGMDIQACITSYVGGKKGEISNNMIVVGGTGTSTGIYCNATTNKNFYYNSILTTGTNPTSSRGLFVNGPSGAAPVNANFTVTNNIFMATTGKGLYNSVGGIIECDYNQYYVTAGTDIAYWDASAAVADLAALQTANSDDANSQESDPVFVSDSDPFDLHIQITSPCIDQALSLVAVTDDIENDSRATDIGADERGAPLPIELVSFTASQKGKDVELDWITVSEINNAFFTVERAYRPERGEFSWSIVGTKDGAGTSNSLRYYFMTDEDPTENYTTLHELSADKIIYYRLKQTDHSGEGEYSDIIAIQFEKERPISILPNPTTGIVKITLLENEGEKFEVAISNPLGEPVISEQILLNAPYGVKSFDLSRFGKGIYIVNVKNSYVSVTEKIIVY